MQSTIEQTDVSEPRSADIATALTYEDGDVSTSPIAGLQSPGGRRRRSAVLGVVAALTTVGCAVAIAIAVVVQSERDQGTDSIPGLVEAPPLAEPWLTSGAAAAVPVSVEAPPLAEPWVTSGAAAAVPVLVEAPPLAEPEVAR